MATIIVSEKNKAAKAIAEALGTVKIIKESKKIDVYYVSKEDTYVIPLRGHICEYKNSSLYKSWTKTNPRDIITDSNAVEKLPISGANPYIKVLKDYSKKADLCIIGTDADIEGCNIGLYDALPYIIQVNKNITIQQLWLSSLQKTEIQHKMTSLIPPKYSWGASGEARAIIDAVIGFSATREVTNTLRPLLNKFKIRFTSIGRVQTCLLYLIYLRESEILNFKPEPYYNLNALLIHQKGTFLAHHESNPFKKDLETIVKKIYEKIKHEKEAKVLDNSSKIMYRSPPTPLNTTKALVLLTKYLKVTPNLALNTMNALYLNQLISYPRTDSDVYRSDFQHLPILNQLRSHSNYGNYTNNLFTLNRTTPTKGTKDAGDHPPITPLESVELASSKFENSLQVKVYDLLTRHYLALFGEKATESKQILKLLIKDEPFKSEFVSLISEGFLEIAPFLKPQYQTNIQISTNIIPVKEIIFEEKFTQPPPRYTDTSLIKLMEKNNIGTKSTRPIIIKLLQTRKLIVRSKGHYLISELGIFLMENLIKIWLPFLKPDFTSRVEVKLEEIKDQKRKMEDVVKEVKQEFLILFDKFLTNKKSIISEIDKYNPTIIAPTASRLTQPALTSSNCPTCGVNNMKFINLTNKRFLVCNDANCKTFLSLPKKGHLNMLSNTCSLCGFNIFEVTLSKNNKNITYYLCPVCWNKSFKSKEGKGFCSNCENYKISKGICVKK
ncbi:MAG: DNA topoisomerase [Candidatus Hermodarchaeota archaeon]